MSSPRALDASVRSWQSFKDILTPNVLLDDSAMFYTVNNINEYNKYRLIDTRQCFKMERKKGYIDSFQLTRFNKNREDILQTLKDHSIKGISPLELAKETKLTYRTIAKHLTSLIKEGIVRKDSKTRKLYEITGYFEKSLQEIQEILTKIDCDAAMYQVAKEDNKIWQNLEDGKLKGAPFNQVMDLFEKNRERVQNQFPLPEILASIHKINMAIYKDNVSTESYYTMIKGNNRAIVSVELMKGLDHPFILSNINLPKEWIEEIQKRNKELSNKIMQQMGINVAVDKNKNTILPA